MGGKLYSPQQIGVAAFVGTPLPACWMLAQNYTVLGKPGPARQAWVFGLLGSIALLGIAFVLPDKFPRTAIPVAYSLAMRELAKQRQGEAFAAHLAAGGERQSNWRVAGVAAAGFAVTLAVVFVVVLLLPESAVK